MEMLTPFLAAQSTLQLFRAAMVVLGALAIVLGLRTRYKKRSEQKWPAVAGRVVHSHLESTAGPQTRLSVSFRYKVQKRPIESRPLSVDIPSAPAAANRTLKRLATGRRVVVHYDPTNPERVLVDTSHTGNWLEAVAAGSALILFALYAF